jgi:hypothetical protein
VRIELDTTKLDEIERNFPGRADDFVMGLALDCEREAKQSFGSGPPGRTYKRGKKVHVASRPGYPPNVDTGALWNSIQGRRLRTLVAATVVNAEHGVYMEYGTSQVAPRPFLLPAAETTAENARKRGVMAKAVTG